MAKNEGFCAASPELRAPALLYRLLGKHTQSAEKIKKTWSMQRVCVASDPSRFPPLNKNTHTPASPPTCSGSAHKHNANHIPHSTLPLLSEGSEVNKMTASQGGRRKGGGQTVASVLLSQCYCLSSPCWVGVCVCGGGGETISLQLLEEATGTAVSCLSDFDSLAEP